MTTAVETFGEKLRGWRRRRRLSQLDLAMDAEISQRHLSFLESGRSTPSREMVLRLAERIAVPLRERNALLISAGFAPVYRERALDDPALNAAQEAVEQILRGHEPYPALAVDRHWVLLMANGAVPHLLNGVDAELLKPPVNVLRLSLHPAGLAGRIANLHEWRTHIFERLAHQIDSSGDPVLTTLLTELKAYPTRTSSRARLPASRSGVAGIAVPLALTTADGVLSFLSTTTIFGTPTDISLSELAIEAFFPADPATAEAMRRFANPSR